MLSANVIWIPPGEEGGPAGGALGLDVVLLEDDALVSQVLQVGGDDGGVVPGHVIVAQVICQDEDNVRRTSVLSAFVFVAMPLVDLSFLAEAGLR